MAKKRDASTDLLQPLHVHMKQQHVDFVGERLQHECFIHSLVTRTRIQSFQHLAIRFLWRLGALEEQNRERTGFLIVPKRPYEWRVDSHG